MVKTRNIHGFEVVVSVRMTPNSKAPCFTLPKFNIAPEKIEVRRLLSYWEGNFSGAMLNFGSVSVFHLQIPGDYWSNCCSHKGITGIIKLL